MKTGFPYNSIIAGLALLSSAALFSCGGGKKGDPFDSVTAEDVTSAVQETCVTAAAAEPVSGRVGRIHINNIGPLREVFNDSNKYHYAVAERIGIAPITGISEGYHTRRPVVRIESCRWYEVDSLKHSVPYLVPEAARLLESIGRNFIDSLSSRGAGGYRVLVTSLLRTPYTVKRLRRVNRNATDSSTHQFATTFDISYRRFHCLDSTRTVNEEDLKNLLGEVLLDLRREERCLVKFERHSPCFHITTTGK